MSLSVGPLSIEWNLPSNLDSIASSSSPRWGVTFLESQPVLRGPTDAQWFNDDEWSGVETPSWLAWISNRNRRAMVWGPAEATAKREGLAVVVPAALRREGFLDGHGAVIAPDATRPNDGVFVTGLSGSGKSSLTVSCAKGSGRFLSDDSVAIGFEGANLIAWSRRSVISLSQQMHRELIPEAQARPFDDKVAFDARATFPGKCADSLRVCAVAFLERGRRLEAADGNAQSVARTRIASVDSAEAYRRVLMGHPILAVDKGARPSFRVVRALADLPGYQVLGERDLLDPQTACRTLASLLPTGLVTPR